MAPVCLAVLATTIVARHFALALFDCDAILLHVSLRRGRDGQRFARIVNDRTEFLTDQ